MLTKMDTEAANYEQVLHQAQQLGYAKSDQTADVEGYDVRSKLLILTKLAFGVTNEHPDRTISCQGITSIKKEDIQYAQRHDCKIN
jgi:homoserine dehydrogenase